MVALHRPGENPMESKTLKMGERLSMRKKPMQMNSMGIPIGAYKMYSTANDIREWNVKKINKKIQLAENFKGVVHMQT